MRLKPVIGITMGDFNGIGPEVICKALSDKKIAQSCTPLIVGNKFVFDEIIKKIKSASQITPRYINSLEGIKENCINILNIIPAVKDDIKRGKQTNKSITSAFLSLEESIKLWKQKKISAIVTAPLNKSSLKRNNEFSPGQTEFIANRAGSKKYLMLMVSKKIKIGVITTHYPVSEITSLISKNLIIEKGEILYNSLKNDFGIKNPVIGLCALNPHAGDNNLFGYEEEKIILPAVKKLTEKGIKIEGPFAADSLFNKYNMNKFNAFLAMYHDQGLIPFKLLSFNHGINFTAGIPVIRTSPDHGVGYDIADKFIANEQSMKEAIKLAVKLVKRRRH